MKEAVKTALIIVSIPFAVYFSIAAIGWFISDPLNIVPDSEKCEYKGIEPFTCVSKEEYCRSEVREMFRDLNDTIGSNTNNQDQMSKSMIEIYNKCLETE